MSSPTYTCNTGSGNMVQAIDAEGAGNMRVALVIPSPCALGPSAGTTGQPRLADSAPLDFPLHVLSPPPPIPFQSLGSFRSSELRLLHGTWPLICVDIWQPLLSFCFSTVDIGCYRLQILRVYNTDSEQVPQDLSCSED